MARFSAIQPQVLPMLHVIASWDVLFVHKLKRSPVKLTAQRTLLVWKAREVRNFSHTALNFRHTLCYFSCEIERACQ